MKIYAKAGDAIAENIFRDINFREFLTLSRVSKRWKNFVHDEFFARATCRIQEVDKIIATVSTESFARFVKAMEYGCSADFFSKEIQFIPGCTLKAFKERLICYKQFATLMLFWSVFTEMLKENKEVTYVQSPYPAFKKILNAAWLTNTKKAIYDESQCALFHKHLKAQKASEQAMLLIEMDRKYNHMTYDSKPTVKNVIIDIGRYTNLGPVEYDNKFVYIVPSFSMMQTLLVADMAHKALAQEKRASIVMIPTFGTSPTSEMRLNSEAGGRILAVDSPWLALPKEADDTDTEYALFFTLHDFLHSVEANFIPDPYKKATLLLGEVFDTVQKTLQKKDTLLNQWFSLTIDFFVGLETSAFRFNFLFERKKRQPQELFYLFFLGTLNASLLTILRREEISWNMKGNFRNQLNFALFSQLISEINKREKQFLALGIKTNGWSAAELLKRLH